MSMQVMGSLDMRLRKGDTDLWQELQTNPFKQVTLFT